MPKPSRPALLAHNNKHPPRATSAQRLRIANPARRPRRRPQTHRVRQVRSRGAADAVREVHVVPVRAVLEGQPRGAVPAPAGAVGAVAAHVGRRVEVADPAGGLLARMEGVVGRGVVGLWGDVEAGWLGGLG